LVALGLAHAFPLPGRGGVETQGGKMAENRTDESVLAKIKLLVDEEHALYSAAEPSGDSHARLEELRIELDQCWDLLRQRRALREFGRDPDQAAVRPADVVEHYKQ